MTMLIGIRRATGCRRLWEVMLSVLLGAAIPGCLESSMSYSPDGKHLALVTCEPVSPEGLYVQGGHSYRLMILSDRKALKVLEDSRTDMLSGPAFSPDGRRLCYLRIPLPAADQLEKLQEEAEERLKKLAELRALGCDEWTRAVTDPRGGDQTKPLLETTDATLPGVAGTGHMLHYMMVHPQVTGQLVVRDSTSGQIVTTTPVEVPFPDPAADYHVTRVRYGPRGKFVYVGTAMAVHRIHPVLETCHRLAAPAYATRLSPDGKTLATLQQRAIAFVATDGSKAVYRKWPTAASTTGIAWADNDTLAVLSYREGAAEDGSDVKTLHFVRKDGEPQKAVDLELPGDPGACKDGEIAVSPDGKRLVVTYMKDVHFLDRAGKVLKHIHDEKALLLGNPTFRPDGQAVAVKRIVKVGENAFRVAEVLFFTPDGERLAARKIPSIRPDPDQAPTTATAPAE